MIWCPLHCDCVIRHDTLVTQFVRTCTRHSRRRQNAALGDGPLRAQLERESRNRNFASAELIARVSALGEPVLSTDGQQLGMQLRAGVVTWHYDEDGTLHILTAINLTAGQRNVMRNALQSRFGGEVVLDG